MSAFLDEVFAAQDARHRPPRRTGEGLSGSGKRFATLLTLMVGLTAVPTFIMVRAGADELRAFPVAPVRPILLEVPEKTPPSNKQPLVIEPRRSWSLPVMPPPQPVAPQRAPILERTAVVDTSARPVAKKLKKAKQAPAIIPVPVPPSLPSDSPVREPKQHGQKRHHVERPRVQRPEKPEVVRPDVVKPYRARAERARS
jgi:hypothetical protein